MTENNRKMKALRGWFVYMAVDDSDPCAWFEFRLDATNYLLGFVYPELGKIEEGAIYLEDN